MHQNDGRNLVSLCDFLWLSNRHSNNQQISSRRWGLPRKVVLLAKDKQVAAPFRIHPKDKVRYFKTCASGYLNRAFNKKAEWPRPGDLTNQQVNPLRSECVCEKPGSRVGIHLTVAVLAECFRITQNNASDRGVY